jgi:hypothetical protein
MPSPEQGVPAHHRIVNVVCKLKATVQVPLYDPGYTLPVAALGLTFDPNGLSPALLAAWATNINNPPDAVSGVIPAVGYFADLQQGTIPGVHKTIEPTWADGYTLVLSGVGSGASNVNYLPFSSLTPATQGTFTKLTFPGIDIGAGLVSGPFNFAPPLGETVVERKYGTLGMEFKNPAVNPPPGSNINAILLFEYGGNIFQGFGIQMGGDDPALQWGQASWLTGTSIINNGYLDATLGIAQNYTYFSKNSSNRPGPVIVEWVGQQYSNPDYNYRNGTVSVVSFDDPVLQAAYATRGFQEISCTRNGWTAILQVNDYLFPGSKWAFLYMDYGMQNYYLLKLNPVAPGAQEFLAQSVQFPTFKIGPDGISWLYNPGAGGHIYYSFSADLSFDPTIYPVPAATFSLPCFDPCNPELWESQISATFKPPVT